MKKRVHIWIYGLIKGVFFRVGIKEQADALSLKGFARNTTKDGRECVEAIFEGDAEAIEKMIEFCKKGPKFSRVQKVEIKEENFNREFEDFKILHF